MFIRAKCPKGHTVIPACEDACIGKNILSSSGEIAGWLVAGTEYRYFINNEDECLFELPDTNDARIALSLVPKELYDIIPEMNTLVVGRDICEDVPDEQLIETFITFSPLIDEEHGVEDVEPEKLALLWYDDERSTWKIIYVDVIRAHVRKGA